jgi:hypothetical protein
VILSETFVFLFCFLVFDFKYEKKGYKYCSTNLVHELNVLTTIKFKNALSLIIWEKTKIYLVIIGWVVSVDHSDLKQVLAEWAVREKKRLF